MAEKRDRIAEVKERLVRIADRDTKIVVAMSKFAQGGLDEDQLKAIASLPPECFPTNGFRDKREARIAWYGTQPRAKWPAAMQAAHERVSYVQRKEKSDDGRLSINLQIVNIPAAIAPPPEQEVRRFRRNRRGKLRPMIDVELAPGSLPAIPETDEEEAGE